MYGTYRNIKREKVPYLRKEFYIESAALLVYHHTHKFQCTCLFICLYEEMGNTEIESSEKET